ncbi:hypothetical protein SKAU_G00167120 [Synaphobranchus kaupii]|uniref:Uncharacterized protein n=1 Tax=Synaphobranchus kaupii TaxID=118154 RepID=A0A9Q1FJN5_SYNKA|nr:hypothetical protein SKAU_G00167120 [Synaphobranchus kaupii]
MLVTCKQSSLGRSQSWDTLGGNEGHWDGEGSYDPQARISGRRNSLTCGADGSGGWFEPPPPGVRPPDLELKREPCSYQESLYNQGYQERHEQQAVRKSSVPEMNSHYDRPAMGARAPVPPQDYYQQDPVLAGRRAEDPRGFYRGEQQHPLSRSTLHYGMTAGGTHLRAAIPLSFPFRGMRPSCPLRLPHQAGLSTATLTSAPWTPRQPSATCLVVDPATQGMEGTLSRGMVLRQESPTAYSHIPMQKVPYDPGYDPTVSMGAPVVTPGSIVPPPHLPLAASLPAAMPAAMPAPAPTPAPGPSPLPPVMPTPAGDPKRNVDPEFLMLLRGEGLSESTISSLLQQGFDSAAMLAIMEENDVRSVAPNLGQARMLSRMALSFRRLAETPSVAPQGPTRPRSNSFSHRNDLYLQQQGLDPQLFPQPPNAMQTISVSPRVGEIIGRRPNSAPLNTSWKLLATTASVPL